MLMTRRDCLKTYDSDYRIKQRIQAGELFMIQKGVYSKDPDPEELSVLSFKYPKAIVTMTSAFFYYDLTDVIPEQYDFATDRDSAKIKDPRIKQYFMPHGFLEQGAVTGYSHGEPFRIYSRERMLVELLRNKARMPFDLYKEVVQNYRKIVYQMDIRAIQDYALASPKSELILETLQLEVL